jgi:hypothetical protein
MDLNKEIFEIKKNKKKIQNLLYIDNSKPIVLKPITKGLGLDHFKDQLPYERSKLLRETYKKQNFEHKTFNVQIQQEKKNSSNAPKIQLDTISDLKNKKSKKEALDFLVVFFIFALTISFALFINGFSVQLLFSSGIIGLASSLILFVIIYFAYFFMTEIVLKKIN